jgi:soluble lytic murein transglycosylase
MSRARATHRLQIGDPTARKLVEWALLDTSATRCFQPNSSRTCAASQGWPREEARLSAGERALDRAYVGPDAAIALFARIAAHVTIEGTIALADALGTARPFSR